MNISFIINNLSFGGAEKMATFVTNNLAKRGHEVSKFVLQIHINLLMRILEFITTIEHRRAIAIFSTTSGYAFLYQLQRKKGQKFSFPF